MRSHGRAHGARAACIAPSQPPIRQQLQESADVSEERSMWVHAGVLCSGAPATNVEGAKHSIQHSLLLWFPYKWNLNFLCNIDVVSQAHAGVGR